MANSRCDWILVTSLTFDHESIFFPKNCLYLENYWLHFDAILSDNVSYLKSVL